MKNFSIFEQALGLALQSQTEDLGRITNISRRDFYNRESFIFHAQAPCIEYLSLLIENELLLRPNRAGRVYAGFERLSRMEPIMARYLRIADLSERLYVFGEPDWKPPRHPNMKLITCRNDFKLTREWFIIANSPTVRAALIAFDEEALNGPAPETRRWRAIKTSNPSFVAQLAEAAEGVIDSALAA